MSRNFLKVSRSVRKSRTLEARSLCSTSDAAADTVKSFLPEPVYIVNKARTPIGSYGGSLKSLSATDLGSIAVREAVRRSGIRSDVVEELIMGNVLSAGLGQAPARVVCTKSGLPASTICTTVNKVCSSGLKAVTMGAQSIALGLADVVVAGGMESMSQVPYYSQHVRFGKRMGDSGLADGMIKDGLWDSASDRHMGSVAEEHAQKAEITREDMDGFTATSYSRAARSVSNHLFKEIVKVDDLLEVDEEIDRVKLIENLPTLKPAFAEGGSITAGNSSKLSDGAAAVVLASRKALDKYGLVPQAQILSFADAERVPEEFPIAPALAIPLALQRCSLTVKEVDLFEINEAFASVVVANSRLLNLNPERVNMLGGAIAMGHPIGASGARILTTLISGLYGSNTSTIGVAGICNGGGGSTAIVISKDV